MLAARRLVLGWLGVGGLAVFALAAAGSTAGRMTSASAPARSQAVIKVPRDQPVVVIRGSDGSEAMTLRNAKGHPQDMAVTDSAGIVSKTKDCKTQRPTRAICGVSGEMFIDAKGGSDRVRVRGDLRIHPQVDITGGYGRDRLIAGNTKSLLLGDRGSDYLRGGPRFDGLFGGRGFDSFHARGGRDLVDARDKDRDRVIACGAGRDFGVDVDKIDPKPHGC